MAYSAEISRDNPTAFLFLIDQSGSMNEQLNSGRSKAEFLADVLNKTLYTLVTSCARADGVRSYFDVGVIAYGDDGPSAGFGGALSADTMHSIRDIGRAPLRIEDRTKKVDDGAGGIIDQRIKFPIWFDPTSSGGTPMCAALEHATRTLDDWCTTHAHCYPPTVLHVTDGESTDGDPEAPAAALRTVGTNDGSVLFFNLHVTSAGAREILFPSDENAGPDDYARALFRMSSIMPPHLVRVAGERGYRIRDGARGFIFNGDPKAIVDFFDIGTRPRLISER